MTAKLNPDLIGRTIEDEEELQRREQAGKEVAENIEQLKSFLLDGNYAPTDDDIYKARVILDTVKSDNLTLEGYDNKIVDRLMDFASRKATDEPNDARQEKSDKTLSAEDMLIMQEVDEMLKESNKYPERDVKFLKKCKKLLQDNPEELTDKMMAEINEIKIRKEDGNVKKEKLREMFKGKVEALIDLGKESFDDEDWDYLRRIKNILIQGPDSHPLAFKQENFKVINERIKEIKKKIKVEAKKSKSKGNNDAGNDKNDSRNNIPKDELEEMQHSAFEDFIEKDLDNNIDRLKGQINKIEEELIEIKERQKSDKNDQSFGDSYLRFIELRNELAKLKDRLRKLQSIERPSKAPNKKSADVKDIVNPDALPQKTPETKTQKVSTQKEPLKIEYPEKDDKEKIEFFEAMLLQIKRIIEKAEKYRGSFSDKIENKLKDFEADLRDIEEEKKNGFKESIRGYSKKTANQIKASLDSFEKVLDKECLILENLGQKNEGQLIKVKEPKAEPEAIKPESDKEAIREIYAKLREEMASRQVDSNIDTSTPQNHRENNEPDIPDQPINRAINQEEQGFFKKHWPKLLVNAVAWTGISIATLIAILGFGKKGEVSEAPANGTAKAEANPGAKSTAEVAVTSTLDIVQSPVSTQNPVETATQATTPVAETSNSAPAVETIAPVANTPARVVEKSGIEVQNYEGVENAYTASLQASVLGSRVVQINNGSFLIDLGDRIDKLGYKIEKSQLVEIEKIENRFMGLSRNVRGFNINAKDFAIRNNLSNEIKNFIRKNCNKVSQGELPPQLRDKMQDRNSLEQREHLARINAIRDKVNKGEELKEAEYDFAQRNEEELGFKVEK